MNKEVLLNEITQLRKQVSEFQIQFVSQPNSNVLQNLYNSLEERIQTIRQQVQASHLELPPFPATNTIRPWCDQCISLISNLRKAVLQFFKLQKSFVSYDQMRSAISTPSSQARRPLSPIISPTLNVSHTHQQPQNQHHVQVSLESLQQLFFTDFSEIEKLKSNLLDEWRQLNLLKFERDKEKLIYFVSLQVKESNNAVPLEKLAFDFVSQMKEYYINELQQLLIEKEAVNMELLEMKNRLGDASVLDTSKLPEDKRELETMYETISNTIEQNGSEENKKNVQEEEEDAIQNMSKEERIEYFKKQEMKMLDFLQAKLAASSQKLQHLKEADLSIYSNKLLESLPKQIERQQQQQSVIQEEEEEQYHVHPHDEAQQFESPKSIEKQYEVVSNPIEEQQPLKNNHHHDHYHYHQPIQHIQQQSKHIPPQNPIVVSVPQIQHEEEEDADHGRMQEQYEEEEEEQKSIVHHHDEEDAYMDEEQSRLECNEQQQQEDYYEHDYSAEEEYNNQNNQQEDVWDVYEREINTIQHQIYGNERVKLNENIPLPNYVNKQQYKQMGREEEEEEDQFDEKREENNTIAQRFSTPDRSFNNNSYEEDKYQLSPFSDDSNPVYEAKDMIIYKDTLENNTKQHQAITPKSKITQSMKPKSAKKLYIDSLEQQRQNEAERKRKFNISPRTAQRLANERAKQKKKLAQEEKERQELERLEKEKKLLELNSKTQHLAKEAIKIAESKKLVEDLLATEASDEENEDKKANEDKKRRLDEEQRVIQAKKMAAARAAQKKKQLEEERNRELQKREEKEREKWKKRDEHLEQFKKQQAEKLHDIIPANEKPKTVSKPLPASNSIPQSAPPVVKRKDDVEVQIFFKESSKHNIINNYKELDTMPEPSRNLPKPTQK